MVKYIISMQELDFGLTLIQIRKLAYKLADRAASEKNNPFDMEEEAAREWWWKDFKNRYGLCLRVPENIVSYLSSMVNRTILNDFYDKLKHLLVKLGIENRPDLIWNCDETGLSYLVKHSKIVTAIGKKYVYKKSYADRGENHTMLVCINASGHWIPPIVIFKGIRLDEQRNILRVVQPLHCFHSTSKASYPLYELPSFHVPEGVIYLAKASEVFILTFPSHTTRMLQPLDVDVYRPFKQARGKSLSNHMMHSPGQKPNRSDFHRLMKPAFYSAFSPETIISNFRKMGIYPFNHSAVTVDAI
ncbi:hypothetical protein PR048_017869 [Dryococelus australis]|uniref:DDE-1 domain-containing protein n=1 Tax=Dryococelus australis TaxID=614101 RepID=A0ABQ9HAT1_9NEOP|nr:hypothetical protein PR048_017869 [Dryococelus australis]